MTKLLHRFINDPLSFVRRASLKYSYKMLPDFLNFAPLRGFPKRAEFCRFYDRYRSDFSFVVPLGMPFGYMKQRPQHIASHIRKHFPVFYYTGALFVNEDRVKGTKEIEDNLFLVNDGINGNSIFDLQKRILYLYWPIDHFFYLPEDDETFVVYDYLDEIDISPRYSEDTHQKHLLMLKRADLILASSQNLFDKIPKEYLHKAMLVTNGVDVEHFVSSHVEPKSAREKVTVGFYGALEKWIDMELIEKIATLDGVVVRLIGPVIDPAFERLKSVQNIEMLGYRPYESLPALTQDVDIFMLPFHISELTLSVSPVKLFEYFATGKPVISTALPECSKYETVFIIDHDNYAQQIQNAQEMIGDKDYIEQSISYAKENSWDAKVRLIAENIKKRIESPKSSNGSPPSRNRGSKLNS